MEISHYHNFADPALLALINYKLTFVFKWKPKKSAQRKHTVESSKDTLDYKWPTTVPGGHSNYKGAILHIGVNTTPLVVSGVKILKQYPYFFDLNCLCSFSVTVKSRTVNISLRHPVFH